MAEPLKSDLVAASGVVSVARTREMTEHLQTLLAANPGCTQHRVASAAMVYGLRALCGDLDLAKTLVEELRGESQERRRRRDDAVRAARTAAKAGTAK